MGSGKEKNFHLINNLLPVVIILLITGWLEFLNLNSLPNIKSEKPSTESFAVSNARAYLHSLMSFGPRVTGSYENEFTTPNWLQEELKRIKESISDANINLEIDFQRPTSSFYVDFLGGINNVYTKVSNVVARVSWKDSPDANQNAQNAILVNAHYDSVPASPGAADDGIGIACMLEIIRALTHGPKLDFPVIFLFNGAEEWNHQAAHGFITQHPWSKQVKYILNLEAIGSGGREIMFQCNSGYVARLYGKSVPYPQASVMAHELFKYFLYQFASTDWSVFIEHGPSDIRGFDTAYTKNGYVYHTSFDSENVVPDGTIYNTGENNIHMIRTLGNKNILTSIVSEDTKDGDEHAVFFDFFLTFLVEYSGIYVVLVHSTAVILGSLTIFFILRSSLYRNITISNLISGVKFEFFCFLFTSVIGWTLGFVAYFFLPMRWYDGGLLALYFLYIPPLVLSNLWFRGRQIEKTYNTIQNHHMITHLSIMLCYILITIPAIYFGVMSAYVSVLWILSLCLSTWIYFGLKYYQIIARNKSLKLKDGSDNSTSQETICITPTDIMEMRSIENIFLLTNIPILLNFHRILHQTVEMMVPLFGKSGTLLPTDVALAGLIALLFSMPIGSIFSHHLHAKIHPKQLKSVGFVILFIWIAYALQGHAYSTERPKRLWIHHLERIYHKPEMLPDRRYPMLSSTLVKNSDENIDHGIWVSGFDESGLSPLLPALNSYTETQGFNNKDWITVSKVCNPLFGSDCFAQFPYYFPVPNALVDAYYIPTTLKPDIPDEYRLKLSLREISTYEIDGKKRRLAEITLQGPSHINLVIRDFSNGKRISRWSLNNQEEVSLDNLPVAEFEKHLIKASPARADGAYFFEVGFGVCSKTDATPENPHYRYQQCLKRIWVEIIGSDAIEVIAYGHYVDFTHTKPVLEFINHLNDWSKGAEWTRFPTILISDVI